MRSGAEAVELDELLVTVVVDNATDTLSSVPERLLAARVRSRGTTVFSACSHAGIVNVGLEALRLLPDGPIDLLLGGYHLAGPSVEERISSTVTDLANLVAPRIVSPGHCTGWRAASALAAAFSPSGFACCVVGTRFILTSSPS
jgi:7,8-dihydropterin-6-yl-methyl-4-(beta-D-ribofuranosyl)aminobenzene 5'-phosphate synthase